MEGLNSNLNLNGTVPPRVRPRVGDFAPRDVPSTRRKRRQRWWTIALALVVLAVLVGVGYYAYLVLRGY